MWLLDLDLQSKFTVYAAIGAMLALLGGIVFYASLDNPSLEQAEIELDNVEIIEINSVDDIVKLQISFLIKNPSE